MKNIKLFIALLLLTGNSVFANLQSAPPATGRGIYTSLNDFMNHKISYETSTRIILNEFTASKYVKVLDNGNTVKLAKKDLFGFRDNNNMDYRFYKNELYQILDATYFFIYTHYASSTVVKGKGNEKKETLYFSVKGTDNLQPLTVENLKKAFPDNLKFHDLLDNVRNDADLVKYDAYTKDIKVNYLYKKSL